MLKSSRGNRLAGLKYAGLSPHKPIILIIGGSLGSVKVNTAVRSILPRLLQQFQIIHICGKGNLDESLIWHSRICTIRSKYVDAPLKHLFAAADLIISRAGANSICESLALRKPNLLIPLSAAASRGDQILNAKSFGKQGFSSVLEEENLTDDTLYQAVTQLYDNRQAYISAMENSHQGNAVNTVISLIEQYAGYFSKSSLFNSLRRNFLALEILALQASPLIPRISQTSFCGRPSIK